MAILGNHDVKLGRGDEQMEVLGMPGRYWAEEHGDVLIVGLDSNEIDDPVQLQFLDDTLASRMPRGGSSPCTTRPIRPATKARASRCARRSRRFLERHGVQLVLSGHDHDYQRSVPIDGVTYVVTGGASGTRRTGEADFTAVAYSWHNLVDIAVTGDQLVLRAIGQDGSVFDEVTLTALERHRGIR